MGGTIRAMELPVRQLRRLAALPRPTKQAILVAFDCVLLPLSVWGGLALRLGEPTPDEFVRLWWLSLIAIVGGVPILWILGLYREVTRHSTPSLLKLVVQGTAISSLILALAMYWAADPSAPRSLPVLYFLVSTAMIGGLRWMILAALARINSETREPVIIYGAGVAGARLLTALGPMGRYRPIALVDDNPKRQHTRISGVPVLAPSAIPSVSKKRGVRLVLLAIPSLSPLRRRAILEKLLEIPVAVRSVPPLQELLSERASYEDLREIAVEDLLGREAVAPDRQLLGQAVAGHNVLITGAGGSIGSELARQCVAHGARRVVMFERSEHALFTIDQELRGPAAEARCELVAILGDVLDRERVEQTCRAFAIETVFHAAAFKHVPLVERNVTEGIANNALGTRVAAEAAEAAGVRRFVLVSTDKAVRPTNVMGASKRLAELILQAFARRGSKTLFTMVRFGNVLGSSGSVVPTFRKQIARGGPVTVTHPDIIRYFMTIPEAAQLVMQVAGMAEGGEVYLLDMGEPVRIIDLAKRMIRLAGKAYRSPESSDGIEIKFTGLRPGEKIQEELLIDSTARATPHQAIFRASEPDRPWSEIAAILGPMAEACVRGDAHAVRELLAAAVPEYRAEESEHDEIAKARLASHGGDQPGSTSTGKPTGELPTVAG
jgi:FlaA1/EpsC-like NDP-sugar epimerase